MYDHACIAAVISPGKVANSTSTRFNRHAALHVAVACPQWRGRGTDEQKDTAAYLTSMYYMVRLKASTDDAQLEGVGEKESGHDGVA